MDSAEKWIGRIIATSIDAMAAGFGLTLLAANLYVACLVIGQQLLRSVWPVFSLAKKAEPGLKVKREFSAAWY